jgi:sugar lactone lactonase YvrE
MLSVIQTPSVFILTCGLALSNCAAAGSKIDPVAFRPEKIPALTGAYAPNERLVPAEKLGAGQLQGPEDIALDPQGFIYTGTADGEVKRISDQGVIETYAVTGGHPLGLDFDGFGNLYVAEPYSGLLAISPDREVKAVIKSFQGQKLGLVDDVKVASDGLVYFTEASTKYPLDRYQLDFLESRPNGRLFRYDPLTQETTLLLDQLYFANGIALSTAEDFLVVAETSRYQLTRYWLKGPKAGQRDIFLSNLPGLPDTISSNGRGTIWVAFFSTRDKLIDSLLPYPFVKALLAKLPTQILPKPKVYGFIAAYDEEGQVIETLQDPQGKTLGNLTSVEEFEGKLYMGTLNGDYVGVLPLE